MDNTYLSSLEANAINALSPGNQVYGVGDKLRNALSNGFTWKAEQRYYVDGVNGDDDADGLSWESAFATIQHAVNIARYIDGTATIDTALDHHKYIFIATGQYNEQVLFSGYNIHLIGCSPLSNGDYGVVINYNDAIVATAVLGFSGSGLEISNICFQCSQAIPIILLSSVSDAVHIHDCWIKGNAGKTPTMGISCAIKNSLIENNVINGCITGIDVAAGAWFNNSIVRNNKITNVTNGIAIANTAVPTESQISRNNIVGSVSSIVNAQATDVLITENYVKPVPTDAGSTSGDNVTLS